MSYSFSLSTYCGNVVYEREKKLKYALNVMGCRKLPYWLGTFAFDYTIFVFVSACFMAFYFAFGIQAVIPISTLGYWIGFLLTMGFSLLQWSYIWSFIFSTSASAYKYMIWINYFISFGVAAILAVAIKGKAMNFILICISPFFAMAWGFISFGKFAFVQYP